MSNDKLLNGKKQNHKKWYLKAIEKHWKHKEGTMIATALVLVFCAIISAQVFILNDTFVWVDIAPIKPLPWIRYLFSAITFVAIGAVLYYFMFYKALSFIFHNVLNGHRGYISAKRIIWLFLTYFTYAYIQHIVIDYLNKIVSFAYNIISFLIFLLPSLGIVIAILISYLLVKRLRSK